MTDSSPWPFVQAWLVLAVITYGLLSLFAPAWRRRTTRIVLSVFAPLAAALLIVWWILRMVGAAAGSED